jgi:hypothetical protein
VWYSLGEVRRFREWRLHEAAVNAEMDRRKRLASSGFASWLNAADAEPWPFALVGPHRRPVDVWATIRGEVVMARTDHVAWLSVEDYLRARLAAARAEQGERDDEAAVAKAGEREARGVKLSAGIDSNARTKLRTKGTSSSVLMERCWPTHPGAVERSRRFAWPKVDARGCYLGAAHAQRAGADIVERTETSDASGSQESNGSLSVPASPSIHDAARKY